MVIWDLITGLGLGEQFLAATALFVAAFYLVRGLRLGKTIGTLVGSTVMYVVVSAVLVAVALALGWLDPRPGVVMDALQAAKQTALDILLAPLRHALEGVI